LVPRWGLGLALTSFVGFPIALNLATPPHPVPVLLLGTALAVIALFLLAFRLPAQFPVAWRGRQGARPRVFFVVGIALTLSGLVVTSVLPLWLVPVLDVIALLLCYTGALGFVLRRIGTTDVTAGAAAFAGGLLAVWFVVDVLGAFLGEPQILVVTVGFVLTSLIAWNAAKQRGVDPTEYPSPTSGRSSG
jgi:hypothetical protein